MKMEFKKTIVIEREWLSRLVDLGKEVSKNKIVKISDINYLLGYIESAELIINDKL